ncbi:MAG TPA: sugar ABC transporter permease [Clostridiaceae bacterium]|nr:sugar ABC transporter permease [Clostridiaceae bacterium]
MNDTVVTSLQHNNKTIKGIGKKGKIKKLIPYLWIAPSVLLIAVIIFVPILELFLTSFSKVSLAGIRKGLIGFGNFKDLFSDKAFLIVLKNTLVWTIAVVGISTVLSIGIALILNKKFPGRRIVRAVLIFPWATSLIITAAMWKYIFDFNYGIMNLILQKAGIIKENIYWLAKPEISFPVLIWVGIFVTIPFTSFVILAGLQTIPIVLYESGSIDGASGWRSFCYITLPLLKESLTVSTVLNVIYVFNSFPIIWTITRGDPLNQTDTVVTYLYKMAFQANKMGQAAAVSVISFLILLAFSILYVSIVMRRSD